MELPFNTTISADILKGTRPVQRARRDLGDAAALGARGLRRARSAPATHRQRLHGGEGSRAHEVRLSRPALAGRRSGRRSASRRSATSTACTCRTSTPGRRTRAAIDRGELPLGRAYRPTADERLIRELVLQLKRGSIRPGYFARQVRRRRPRAIREPSGSRSRADGYLARRRRRSRSRSRATGCCASTSLLHRFFLPEHVGVRYT